MKTMRLVPEVCDEESAPIEKRFHVIDEAVSFNISKVAAFVGCEVYDHDGSLLWEGRFPMTYHVMSGDTINVMLPQ